MSKLSPIQTIMLRAAEKAGRSLTRDYGEVENLQVSRKGPADFVTAADKRAEEIIHEELSKARPGYSFLMEEGGVIKGDGDAAENKWIIDPLDGTHNFMHGIPHWCVSIALESNGKLEAGVIYDPIKEETFVVERNGGAWINGRKRLRVSGRNDLEMAAVGYCTSPIRTGNINLSEIRNVSMKFPMLRHSGSAALDLAYVATGRLDGYWERGIKAWDVAAGVLMIKESGGFVNSIDDESNPVYSNQIVCGNQAIYTHLRKTLKETAKKAA